MGGARGARSGRRAPRRPSRRRVPSGRSAHRRAPAAGATHGHVSHAAPDRSAAEDGPPVGLGHAGQRTLAEQVGAEEVERASGATAASARGRRRGCRADGRRARRARAGGGAPRARPIGAGAAAAARRRSPSRDRAASAPPPPACASPRQRPSSGSTARCRRSPRGSSRAGQPCGSTIRRASAGASMCPPRENGCAAKPTPPASRTASAISRADRPACGDLPIDAEGEVVACLRTDLGPDEHEDALVPALPAVAARRQRVVVGQQHDVGAGGRRVRGDLVDRGRAVGVGAVHVHHAGHIHRGRRGYPRWMPLRLLGALGLRAACGRRRDRPAPPLARRASLPRRWRPVSPRRWPRSLPGCCSRPRSSPGRCSPPPAGWRSAPSEERCSLWAARCSEGWRPSRSRARPRAAGSASGSCGAARRLARVNEQLERRGFAAILAARLMPGVPAYGPALRGRRLARPLRRVHGRDRDRRARCAPPPTPCSGRVWRPARRSPSRWPSFPSRSAARARWCSCDICAALRARPPRGTGTASFRSQYSAWRSIWRLRSAPVPGRAPIASAASCGRSSKGRGDQLLGGPPRRFDLGAQLSKLPLRNLNPERADRRCFGHGGRTGLLGFR